MAQRVASTPVPLVGVPEGLRAFPVEQVAPDGAAVRTRRGRAKLEVVELRSTVTHGDAIPLGDIEEAFVLGAARRRWSTIEARFGAEAWSTAVRLAGHGAISVRCRVDGGSRVGAPIEWLLAPALGAERERRREAAMRDAESWNRRAADAAARVESLCPELAAAVLAARPGSPSSHVLVHASEDLAAGVSHAGPRAFSQTHFGDTKARDDVVDVLRGAGAPDEVVVALGLRRGDRVGISGPVAATVGEQVVRFAALDGPVLLRADQPGLTVTLDAPCPLVVVENLQAAESVADHFPEVAVFYTAGMLGVRALELLAGLAALAERVVLAVDADAGGVRIAEQVLGVVPSAALLDAGAHPHAPRDEWAAGGLALATLERATEGPASALARACLARGYPVEQESAIVESVAHALPLAPRDRRAFGGRVDE